jgi:hypothetical protein
MSYNGGYKTAKINTHMGQNAPVGITGSNFAEEVR